MKPSSVFFIFFQTPDLVLAWNDVSADLIFSRFFQCQPHIVFVSANTDSFFNLLSPEDSLKIHRKISWFSEINRMKVCSINLCLFFRVSTEIDIFTTNFLLLTACPTKCNGVQLGHILIKRLCPSVFIVIEEQWKIMWECQGA
jgi:hypothetical protein